MDFIGSQHGESLRNTAMVEMGRLGHGHSMGDIIVPSRYALLYLVFEVGYVPILGFAFFSRFG